MTRRKKKHSHLTLKTTKIVHLALQIIDYRYLIDIKSALEDWVNIK